MSQSVSTPVGGASYFLIFSPGVDYITFFDLAMKDSAIKEEVVEPDSLGQESSDYYSSPVFIENGVPIGATGELSTLLYVRKCMHAWMPRPRDI